MARTSQVLRQGSNASEAVLFVHRILTRATRPTGTAEEYVFLMAAARSYPIVGPQKQPEILALDESSSDIKKRVAEAEIDIEILLRKNLNAGSRTPSKETPMPKYPEDKDDAPHWPTLEEQLKASKVIPGSALEKLIRENQNFDTLCPEEAHDKLRLPPWLRVYWRKKHPELRHAAHDPTGGYPLALRDLYLWMLQHQDLEVQREPESGKGGENAD